MQRSFFNKEWSDEPEGATLRLDSVVRSQVVNTVYRKQKNGWQVVDQQELDARERGFVFQCWKTSISEKEFLAFYGYRAIDGEMASLFKDLRPRQVNGEIIKDPLEIGHQFLLNGPDSKKFHTRLTKMGGLIISSSPSNDKAAKLVRACEQTLDKLNQILIADASVVELCENGDFSRSQELQSRSEEVRALSEEINHKSNQALILPEPGDAQIKERVAAVRQGARMMIEARLIMIDQINNRYKRESTVWSDPEKLLLARELGRLAGSQGFEVKTTTDGVKIKIGDQWLTVGQEIALD